MESCSVSSTPQLLSCDVVLISKTNLPSDYPTFCYADRRPLPGTMPRCFLKRLKPLGLLLLFTFLSLPHGTALGVEPIRYSVDLRSTDRHLVHVAMNVSGAGANTEIQIPAWNALYQIRDFVKDVQDLKGECDGRPVDLERVDLHTWRGPDKLCNALKFFYSLYANDDGPFDSILNSNHAFLNLAMVLFYLPRERQRPVQIKFQVPTGWKLATLIQGDGNEFQAANYDALVDSPVDAGHFEEVSYVQSLRAEGAPAAAAKHTTVRVILDADPKDYSSGRIVDALRKITSEETALMQDLPFNRYTFILQFPRDGGSTGGMEHRDGTAISIPANNIRGNESYLESVAAHEFFHLWNVKRMRPQSLEPIDYIKGNDTRDLWFCEGVTNTYAELVLLRAGRIDRKTFYARVANAIQVLQSREGRHFQSAETSGREAWLEKYSDYNRADRSVSYYNKGELLGYILDLGIRHASHNAAGLDDVMRRLNRDFALRGRYYASSDLAAIVADLAPAFDLSRFLADDVRGTRELDFATALGFAGLNLASRIEKLPEPGFSASRNANGLLQVDSVDAGSDAERAGLLAGDLLTTANGEPLPADAETNLPKWKPGQTVDLQIARGGSNHNIKIRIGVHEENSAEIEEDPHASRDQVRVRDGWLKGVTHQPSGKK